MEKEEVAKNIGMIPEIKSLFEGFKTEVKEYFSKAEPVAEAKVETTAEAPKVEAEKSDLEKFTAMFNEFKTAADEKSANYEKKISELEVALSAVTEVTKKQDELLKKTLSLVEKALETPQVMSTQKKKEGAKQEPTTLKAGLSVWA